MVNLRPFFRFGPPPVTTQAALEKGALAEVVSTESGFLLFGEEALASFCFVVSLWFGGDSVLLVAALLAGRF